MLHIVLYQPEIPPNTGNIIRLAANTGYHLHLIKPLGFELQDKLLRRAGLDYHEWTRVNQHDSYENFIQTTSFHNIYAFTTKGQKTYSEISFEKDDVLLFGPETRGLPDRILDDLSANQKLRLPMLNHSRSLNLSNTVAIAVYESWKQLGFSGS
jgi:tRNA (cytidine/uridine-2'-O-)-methyltransferase